MQFFIEESPKQQRTIVLIDQKDAQKLMEMLEYAVDKNPRKKSWIKILTEFTDRLIIG